MLDKLLEKYDLKYEDLNELERDTLNNWLEAIEKNVVTVQSIKEHIDSMKRSVETELAQEPEYKKILFFKVRNDKNVLLKARIRNYLILEAFLTSPEKAKQQLESALAGIRT